MLNTRLRVAILTLVCAAPSNAQSELTFLQRAVPSSVSAIRITSGDLNADGKLDVAFLAITGTVFVMLGRGDGSFETAREVIRDPLPAGGLIAADVNSDGRLDLISTHRFAGVVSVALGLGDGAFAPARQFPCGDGPAGIVAADINGDGNLDLAVTNFMGLLPSQPGRTVTVLLGQGNGAFGRPISSPVLGQHPDSLAAADFNRDGRADLVVNGILTPDISILISNGDGTFQTPRAVTIPFGVPIMATAVADFNRDGRADVALLGPPWLHISLGTGDGSFQPPQRVSFDSTFALRVADMNGDAIPDVVGTSNPFGAAIVLLGKGNGSFEDQQPFRVAPGPNDLAVGDFDGDGAVDMVTAHPAQPNLTLLLNATRIPMISANGVVNAASFLAGPLTVSPGEIITIFGRNLGPAQLVTAQLRTPEFLSTALANTRAFFDGVAAPIIYAKADQISVVVPYSVSGKSTTQLQVAYGAGGEARSAPLTLRVVAVVPGIFTVGASGTGQAAVLNQDGTLNSPANPAPTGSVITLFATGLGQTDPPGVDGKLATVPLPAPALPVIVGIANMGAEIMYAGAAPGLVEGLFQLNVRVPPAASSGPAAPLVILIGGVFSPPGVTLAIQ